MKIECLGGDRKYLRLLTDLVFNWFVFKSDLLKV